VEEPPHFAVAFAVACPLPTHQKTSVILSGGGVRAAVAEGPAGGPAFDVACSFVLSFRSEAEESAVAVAFA
jgi:hypothetical protein